MWGGGGGLKLSPVTPIENTHMQRDITLLIIVALRYNYNKFFCYSNEISHLEQ